MSRTKRKRYYHLTDFSDNTFEIDIGSMPHSPFLREYIVFGLCPVLLYHLTFHVVCHTIQRRLPVSPYHFLFFFFFVFSVFKRNKNRTDILISVAISKQEFLKGPGSRKSQRWAATAQILLIVRLSNSILCVLVAIVNVFFSFFFFLAHSNHHKSCTFHMVCILEAICNYSSTNNRLTT